MTNSEVLLIGELNADMELQNAGLEAYGEIPDDRPERFITVERTGGQRTKILDYPTWAVQVWAEDRLSASEACDLVRERILNGVILNPEVGALDVTTSYNYPDPDSGQARYQLVVTGVLTV